MELMATDDYQQLLKQISDTYTQGRIRAAFKRCDSAAPFKSVAQIRADYGKALIGSLARDLSLRHGKGFGRSNLVYMRLLYLRYPISQKPSHQLSWSQYLPDREELRKELELSLREVEADE